jgi:hypothetical protein
LQTHYRPETRKPRAGCIRPARKLRLRPKGSVSHEWGELPRSVAGQFPVSVLIRT